MFTRLFPSARTLVWVQIGLVTIAVTSLSFAPPAEGRMALIALDGRDAGRLVQPVIAQDGALVGRGPFGNTLVVSARRDRILLPMLARGVLVIAAPRNWCGAEEARA